jgi:triacylglycerol lipase
VGPSTTNPTGLYGFSTATPIPLFPSLKLHYWASVLEVLRDRLGAKVVVVGVKGYVVSDF